LRLLVYWHDVFLPYSEYLIQAFAADPRITELCIIGPEKNDADSIYAGSQGNTIFPKHVHFEKISGYAVRDKWAPISELRRCIGRHSPNCIIVLDEAFSVNTLNMGIANVLCGSPAKVLFYGFENIFQTPPFQFLLQNLSFKNLAIFLRKTARYFLVDLLLQPIRSKVVHGGLACYWECLDVVHQLGWKPELKQQWWGIDLEPFLKTANDANDGRIEDLNLILSGITMHTKIIGYVGRLIEEKGVFDLLEMLHLLDANYHLVIVGSGPLESVLKQKSIDGGLSDRVTFLPPKPRDKLAKIYAAFDVLILPSKTGYFWKEQYGRVLVEAMACGTPIMGSQSGAIPFVIDKPERCFPEGDIQQMAKIVKSITYHADQMDASQAKLDKQWLRDRSQLGAVQSFINAYISLYEELGGKVL